LLPILLWISRKPEWLGRSSRRLVRIHRRQFGRSADASSPQGQMAALIARDAFCA
jgi:hypothetical protein